MENNIYDATRKFNRDGFKMSYDSWEDFEFLQEEEREEKFDSGDMEVRQVDIHADDEEVRSYYQVVDKAFGIGVLAQQFPFLKFTGSFLTVKEYLKKIHVLRGDYEPELVLSAVICEETTAAYELQEPHDYELATYAENFLDAYCDEKDLCASEVEPLIEMVLGSYDVVYDLSVEADIPISDVFEIEPVFLGAHDAVYTPGSLQFMPYFIPLASAEDAKYTKPVDSPKQGQRKLFCDLSEHVASIPEITTVIYLGAYPGYGVDVYAQSRPDIQFWFSDLQNPTLKKKYYADNVTWFVHSDELSYDPETSLFYSDIYDGKDFDTTYKNQVDYATRLGCKYNSLKRLINFRRLRFEKLEHSKLAHEVWRGAGGELRERFIMREMNMVEFPSSSYERHSSYVDNKVRTTGANVKSRWTACGCHDCKVFQVCLDRAFVDAVKNEQLEKTLKKIKRVFSLSSRRPVIPCTVSLTDINGKAVGEKREPDHAVVESALITATLDGVKEVLFIAPRLRVHGDDIFFDHNGHYERRVISNTLPLSVKMSLSCEGYQMDIRPYKIVRTAVTQAVREDMLCSNSYRNMNTSVTGDYNCSDQ